MRVEWIHCFSGKRGGVSAFPAEMLSDGNHPGITFRLCENGVKIRPDFRAKEIFFNGKKVLASALLEPGVPAFLRMGKTLLVVCAVGSTGNSDWTAHYRFPIWTLFEPETFSALETVRAPEDILPAVKRLDLDPKDCLVAPYGLTVTISLSDILDLF